MKILVSLGTRPELIKMVPVILELNKRDIDVFFVYTGQHRDLADSILSFFNIKPDIDLDIMKERQSLGHITSSILSEIEHVLKKVNPNIVLAHGDTSTTFASTLAAFYHKIPVGHVEAGLRSGNIYSPFPEEMNRTLVGKIASYHFAPTEDNKRKLLLENVNEENIFVTGNTVIDAVNIVAGKFDIKKKKQILVTTHRRENLGLPMESISEALAQIALKYPAYKIILPMHPNPKVREILLSKLEGIENIDLIEPMNYIDFIKEMASSSIVLTDSGGIQEEAPTFDIPVVVLRTETERKEGIEAGTLILSGTKKESIVSVVTKLLDDKNYYNKIANAKNPYGDGTAAKKIVDFLEVLHQKGEI